MGTGQNADAEGALRPRADPHGRRDAVPVFAVRQAVQHARQPTFTLETARQRGRGHAHFLGRALHHTRLMPRPQQANLNRRLGFPYCFSYSSLLPSDFVMKCRSYSLA